MNKTSFIAAIAALLLMNSGALWSAEQQPTQQPTIGDRPSVDSLVKEHENLRRELKEAMSQSETLKAQVDKFVEMTSGKQNVTQKTLDKRNELIQEEFLKFLSATTLTTQAEFDALYTKLLEKVVMLGGYRLESRGTMASKTLHDGLLSAQKNLNEIVGKAPKAKQPEIQGSDSESEIQRSESESEIQRSESESEPVEEEESEEEDIEEELE